MPSPQKSARVTEDVRSLLDQGQPQQALSRLGPLLRDEPDNLEARYLSAVCHLRGGDVSKARSEFQGVIDRDPTVHVAYHGLGLAEEALGDRAGAIEAFREALRVNPEFGPAQRKLRSYGATGATPADAAGRSPAPSLGSSVTRSESGPGRGQTLPPPTAPRKLKPLPGRVLRGLLLLGFLTVLLASLAVLASIGWSLLVEPEYIDVEEAQYFGALAAAAGIVSFLLIRWIRHLANVSIEGVVEQVSVRPERAGGPYGKTVYVTDLVLRVTDQHRHQVPRLAAQVKTKSKHYHPGIDRGETVRVKGTPKRDNYLKAQSVESLTSGLRLRR